MTTPKTISWQWLAGILLAVVFAVVGSVYAAFRADVSENTKKNAQQDVSIGKIQSDVEYIKDGVDDIKHTLRNR